MDRQLPTLAYRVPVWYKVLTWISVPVVLLIGLGFMGGLLLSVWNDLQRGRPLNPMDFLVLILLLGTPGVGLIALGVWGLQWLPALQAGIEVNACGISLVKPNGERTSLLWTEINKLRERRIRQCLELYDVTGTMIRVEYQLARFEELRHIILSEISIQPMLQLPYTVAKSRLFPLFNLVVVLLCLAGGIWMILQRDYLIGGGLLLTLLLIIREYVKLPHALTLTEQDLTLRYPHRQEVIPLDVITGIIVTDHVANLARKPYIILEVKGGQRISLENLGSNAAELAAWLKSLVFDNREPAAPTVDPTFHFPKR